MINWIKRKIEDKKKAQTAEAQKARALEIKRRAEKKQELRELLLITIQNKMYLTSSINVYSSNINNIKGKNGSETKKRREFLAKRIKWMTDKLEEETVMVSYYNRQLSAL